MARTNEFKLRISKAKTKHGLMVSGYKRVYVLGRGRVLEHRLAVEEAVGRRLLPTEIVHHINGNKLDNSATNLRITNRAEHRSFHKNETAKGVELPQAKLNDKKVIKIRELYKNGFTQKELSHKYGVGQDNISRIVNGLYWKHTLTTNN